ncbi:dead end protein homolog 1-like [Pelodytes ibericus]
MEQIIRAENQKDTELNSSIRGFSDSTGSDSIIGISSTYIFIFNSLVWINGINDKNKLALITWMKETKTNLVQINGQRKYGGPPPGWVGEAPGNGSEVFIGKLPQECYEDTLIPLFQSVGKLYEFRLMMTFSGLNRGFAYARYSNRRHAYAAISTLNGFEISSGSRILVCLSTEKCHLTLEGLPCLLEKSLLIRVLKEMTSGVEEVLLYPSLKNKNEVIAVVKYCSHRAAAIAKKNLSEGPQLLHGHPLTIDWLKSDIKQKLETAKHSMFYSTPSLQQMCSPNNLELEESPANAIDCLDALCRRWELGQPLFMIKFLSMSSCGWQRFWYRVVIPNYHVPFSGYAWVIGENLILTEKHEKAKEVVALKILSKLGMSSCLVSDGSPRMEVSCPKTSCWINTPAKTFGVGKFGVAEKTLTRSVPLHFPLPEIKLESSIGHILDKSVHFSCDAVVGLLVGGGGF